MAPISKLRVAWSTDSSLTRAVSCAVGQSLEKSTAPVIGIVFSAGNWDRGALARALSSELGSIPWVGCTAATIFANRKVITDGIAVGIISAQDAFVGIGSAGPVGNRPISAGEKAVAMAIDHLPDRLDISNSPLPHRMIWLLLDSFIGSGNAIVQGAVREGGTNICWAGVGVGGQGRETGRMSLLANGNAFLDKAIALAIDLPVPFGVSIAHSLRPFGPPLSVTKCRGGGSIVQELEYRPAGEVFEHVARTSGDSGIAHSDMRTLLMRYSFGIPQADGDFVIRDVVQRNDAGELQVVAPVPEGCIVRMMRATREEVIDGAREAARAACAQVGGKPGGILVSDCDGRALGLGRDVQRDLDAVAEEAGADTDILGCTSYGEIGKLGQGFPQFHNKSIQVLAFPGGEV